MKKTNRKSNLLFPLAFVLSSVLGCSGASSDDRSYGAITSLATVPFGDPLPGLTAAQLALFQAGQDAFEETENAADNGLGPVFNDVSCVACHSAPAVGGGSERVETRFGRTSGGSFDPLAQEGGSLIQERGIGVTGACNYVGETVPADANVRAGRRTTPLFGLGLIDAVTEGEIRSGAASEPAAVRGIVSMVTHVETGQAAIGRFGWKAQVPTLHVFAGDAYLNEMGVTSPFFPMENCPQGNCDAMACNPRPDLNNNGDDVTAFANFMQMLAPPPRGPTDPSDNAGEGAFRSVGCADCHRPRIHTGPSAIAALNRVQFEPFTDLLLHDMGSLGDGITQNNATGNLMRTAPLWGLRMETRLLHDGRATTIEAAILAHDGQGAAAREAFKALQPATKAKLMSFLGSL